MYKDAVSVQRQELRKHEVGTMERVTEPYVMTIKSSFSQVYFSSRSYQICILFITFIQAKVLQQKNNRRSDPSTWNSLDIAQFEDRYPEEDSNKRAATREESVKRTVVHVTTYRFASDPKLTANIKGQWNYGLSSGKYRIIADIADIG